MKLAPFKTLLAAIVLAGAAIAAPGVAQARGHGGVVVRVHPPGGGHVSGGGYVGGHAHWGGHVHVGGAVVFGGGYYYPGSYYPMDYGYSGYYGTGYYAPPPAPPPAYYAPRRPVFGLGLYFGSTTIGQNGDAKDTADGVGLIARLRMSPRLELEGQLGADQFANASTPEASRQDSRLGLDLLVNLSNPGGFVPFLLVGGGINVVAPQGQNSDSRNLPTYGYLEAGAGLSWELTPHFSLTGDLRLQARHLSKDATNRTLLAGMPDKENATQVRFGAIYYF
jgi:hypothetical protein